MMDNMLQTRLLMAEYRISQREVAKRMGVTPQYVNGLLNGKMNRPLGASKLTALVNVMAGEKGWKRN